MPSNFLAWVYSLVAAAEKDATEPPPEPPIPQRLVDRIDVLVDAYCPCGSKHLHHLTLVSTSECARCGRTLAVREIHYLRSHLSESPKVRVSVGHVFLPESLRRRRTRGVH